MVSGVPCARPGAQAHPPNPGCRATTPIGADGGCAGSVTLEREQGRVPRRIGVSMVLGGLAAAGLMGVADVRAEAGDLTSPFD